MGLVDPGKFVFTKEEPKTIGLGGGGKGGQSEKKRRGGDEVKHSLRENGMVIKHKKNTRFHGGVKGTTLDCCQ